MLIYLIIITIVIIFIIFLFSSPKFSPIPYFPSQPADLPKIIKALNLKSNQIVFDLGAGDGIVIFNAAKSSYQQKLNTKFVAVEINPVLILVLYFRRLFHPNRRNIKIVMDDIFRMNFNSLTRLPTEALAKVGKPVNSLTFYLYISPWFLEKVISNIKDQSASWRTKFSVVSYMYPLKDKTAFTKVTAVEGKNKIFIYN